MEPERCSWCGEGVDPGEGFRALDPAGERGAVFCRLEHVVPWVMQGARWSPSGEAGAPVSSSEHEPALGRCAVCEAEVGDDRLLLVRHRGAHRIPDAFCGPDHLHTWASRGGRWA